MREVMGHERGERPAQRVAGAVHLFELALSLCVGR